MPFLGNKATYRKTPRLWRGVFLLAGCLTVGVTSLGVTSLDVNALGENAPGVHFVEIAETAGLNFTHINGMVGQRWLLETVGAGVAVFDFDGDGRPDIWLVQGGQIMEGPDPRPGDQLFRNTGDDGELRFMDVTAESGVHATGYGMGIATGDIDNDGDLDVFIANYGANQLFENLGDGRFRNISAGSGLDGDAWSVSATFADIDGDGWVDLYVGNYLDFTLGNHRDCRDVSSLLTYCSPDNYEPVPDRLYRNLGAGRFADISDTSGIAAVSGPALGVVAQDFDGDGDTDFYVANDGTANFLWMNQGGNQFINDAVLGFVAFNANGAAEASMGVDAEDFDGDCDVDLFVTHLATETNTLYVNNGGWFMDATNRSGLAASSGPFTGFGTGWFDADNDGDLDLFSANGAVSPIAAQRDAGSAYPLRQRNQLWLNDGRGHYAEHHGGPAFSLEEVSRGAAFADLDSDGDIDIVIANNHGRAHLYRNDSAAASWIGVEVRAATGEAAEGAVVWLEAKPCGQKRVATDGSYASANDPRVVFGLGDERAPQFVRVRWPNGSEARFGPLATGRYHQLRPRKRDSLQ